MKESEIVKKAMEKSKTTQVDLQMALNLKSQSSVSAYLRGKSMKVDTFVKILEKMGYKVFVTNGEDNWDVSCDE